MGASVEGEERKERGREGGGRGREGKGGGRKDKEGGRGRGDKGGDKCLVSGVGTSFGFRVEGSRCIRRDRITLIYVGCWMCILATHLQTSPALHICIQSQIICIIPPPFPLHCKLGKVILDGELRLLEQLQILAH